MCILTCVLQYVLRSGEHSETDLDVENSIITKQVLKRESDPGVTMAGVCVTLSPSFYESVPALRGANGTRE